MASIALDNVSLMFHVRQQRRVPMKEYLVQRLFRRSRNPVLEVKALSNVNLSVSEGDRLGVIGHNGAGKSTLLKVLAGVYPPTHGRRIVEGRISSLFDLVLGFEQEASGWENIAYRGYLQGETPRTIQSKMDAIAEFSELGEFLDTPVKYYSSGMVVRLAFSIATAIEPEILLVDEVLSAGDVAFQKKARKRMHELISQARLLIMVSHDLEAIAEICNRAVWMDHGAIRQAGPPEQIIDAYSAEMERLKAAKTGPDEDSALKLAS